MQHQVRPFHLRRGLLLAAQLSRIPGTLLSAANLTWSAKRRFFVYLSFQPCRSTRVQSARIVVVVPGVCAGRWMAVPSWSESRPAPVSAPRACIDARREALLLGGVCLVSSISRAKPLSRTNAPAQNDGLLDVVQQLSHALEDAAKTEDEMRLVNANMQVLVLAAPYARQWHSSLGIVHVAPRPLPCMRYSTPDHPRAPRPQSALLFSPQVGHPCPAQQAPRSRRLLHFPACATPSGS